jgi:hypothetical protein
MHSFLIGKFDLEFIENKFIITSLYFHEMLNWVISIETSTNVAAMQQLRSSAQNMRSLQIPYQITHRSYYIRL